MKTQKREPQTSTQGFQELHLKEKRHISQPTWGPAAEDDDELHPTLTCFVPCPLAGVAHDQWSGTASRADVVLETMRHPGLRMAGHARTQTTHIILSEVAKSSSMVSVSSSVSSSGKGAAAGTVLFLQVASRTRCSPETLNPGPYSPQHLDETFNPEPEP